jgi:hypothetical protein
MAQGKSMNTWKSKALVALAAVIGLGVALPAAPVVAQNLTQAQINRIKVKFRTAQELFDRRQYPEALARVKEIEQLVGSTQIATAQNLKVKILIEMGRFEEAQRELTALYNNPDFSNEIADEIAVYEPRIQSGLKKEAAARAERKRQQAASAKRSEEQAAKRRLLTDTITDGEFNQYLRFVGSKGRSSSRGSGGSGQSSNQSIEIYIEPKGQFTATKPVGAVYAVRSGRVIKLGNWDFANTLKIVNRGGDGGSGGRGSRGKDGDNASNILGFFKRATYGQKGGRGGDGGYGGSGGSVSVNIYGSTAFYNAVKGSLDIDTRGGKGGKGGEGGPGGRGGYTLQGGQQPSGYRGSSGQRGSKGSDGRKTVRQINRATFAQRISTPLARQAQAAEDARRRAEAQRIAKAKAAKEAARRKAEADARRAAALRAKNDKKRELFASCTSGKSCRDAADQWARSYAAQAGRYRVGDGRNVSGARALQLSDANFEAYLFWSSCGYNDRDGCWLYHTRAQGYANESYRAYDNLCRTGMKASCNKLVSIFSRFGRTSGPQSYGVEVKSAKKSYQIAGDYLRISCVQNNDLEACYRAMKWERSENKLQRSALDGKMYKQVLGHWCAETASSRNALYQRERAGYCT